MKIKSFVISGVCIVAVGIIIFVVALANLGWNVDKLDSSFNSKIFYAENVEEYNGVTSVELSAKDAKVTIEKGSEFRVLYDENNRYKYEVSLVEGKLKIKQTRALGFMMFSFIVRTPEIKITLDNDGIAFDGTLDNGSLSVSDFGFTSFSLDGQNGTSSFKNVTATSLEVKDTNGEIVFEGVNVNYSLNATTTNGEVTANNVTAGSVGFKSTNGQIKAEEVVADGAVKLTGTNGRIYANNLRAESLEAGTTNGNIDCERTAVKGLTLKSTNGDIDITLLGGADEFKFNASSRNGKVSVPRDGSGSRTANITTTNGDINVSFL